MSNKREIQRKKKLWMKNLYNIFIYLFYQMKDCFIKFHFIYILHIFYWIYNNKNISDTY
jgi:hypothetical protein